MVQNYDIITVRMVPCSGECGPTLITMIQEQQQHQFGDIRLCLWLRSLVLALEFVVQLGQPASGEI